MNIKRPVIYITFLILLIILPACGRRAALREAVGESPSSIGRSADAPSIEAIEPEPCPYDSGTGKDWSVRICDGFDDNERGWIEEVGESDLAEYDIHIADSKYIIDYTGKAYSGYTSGGYTWVPLALSSDFSLSITGSMDSVNQYIGWGILFRGSEGNLYLFRIAKDGRYILDIAENGQRRALVDWTEHSAIYQDAPNRLSVAAQGSTVEIFANGILLETLTDVGLQGDIIGLAVMGQEGVQVVFEFDDLIIQAP